MLSKLFKNALLFVTGGSVYIAIEMIWRAVMESTPTHWAMFIIGGVLFLILGGLNEWLPWRLSFIKQVLIGTAIVIAVELVSGCVLNLWLGLGIWDYSDKPLNVFGQICPQFTVAWLALSGVAIVFDDYLRYWLFGEEKPHYFIFANKASKKKREFSKILVGWAIFMTMVSVAVSYVLSYFDHDPCSEITVAVASACIAISVAYEAKSYGEKNSRNKYGVELPNNDDDCIPKG